MTDSARPLSFDRHDGGAARASTRLRGGWRKLLLTIHITVAVAALGTDGVLLGLGITGLASGDPELIRAVYLAMDVIVSAVLLPLAVAALSTGVLLGLSTGWGLARHYWVLAKLILTVGLATAAALILRPTLDEAASTARTVPLVDLPISGIGAAGVRAVMAPTIGVLLLTSAVALAVYKPRGSVGGARLARWAPRVAVALRPRRSAPRTEASQPPGRTRSGNRRATANVRTAGRFPSR
jgi:hypothetical protein